MCDVLKKFNFNQNIKYVINIYWVCYFVNIFNSEFFVFTTVDKIFMEFIVNYNHWLKLKMTELFWMSE